MGTPPYDAMSKAELIAELRRLTAALEQGTDLRELETNQEKLRLQAAQLIDAQRLLEASRASYVELFDFAPIGYAVLDQHGVVRNMNLAAAHLLNAERSRLIGYPFHSYVMDRRVFVDAVREARRHLGPVTMELELDVRPRATRPVPVPVPVHLTLKKLGSSSDDPAAPATYVLMIVDLTDRRRAEDERRRIEAQEQVARGASEAKDHFLAVLSHELRTPLTPILFALASLRQGGHVPASLLPVFDMMERNIELEARLIDDLLDVTRITQGKLNLVLETVDVHAVVEDVMGLCAEDVRQAGVRVTLELEAFAHHARADGTRLRQVVWNLLKNALRSTAGGGSVTIRTANDAPDCLTLSVQDTGTGIASSTLDRLFRPFEQGAASGRTSGLGLGLAISKGIVDAHGGRIHAMSGGEGAGATFTVELPTVRPGKATSPQAKRPTRNAQQPRKILLVEDNRDNATAIAELLRAYGYDVDVADSVVAALRKAEAGFDLLVSDIGLPDGSGRDLLRKLDRNGGVPAIALTGYGTDADVQSNAAAGFTRHLTKPVDPDELLAAITELTGQDADPPEKRARRRAVSWRRPAP